jgi:hypothetical protein
MVTFNLYRGMSENLESLEREMKVLRDAKPKMDTCRNAHRTLHSKSIGLYRSDPPLSTIRGVLVIYTIR